MFSNVLPKVVADTPVGGNVLGSMQAGQNYNKTSLENQFYPQLAQAQVAQQQSQAAAAPLNAMATIASNPMLWALMPDDQRRQMASYLTNTVLKTQQNLSNLQSSPPPQSFVHRAMNALFGMSQQPQQSNQNAMNQMPMNTSGNSITQQPAYSSQSSSTYNNSNQSSPNLPQGNDVGAGVGAKATAPYQEQIHAPSTLYVDRQGNPTYSPATGTVSQYQTALDSISRVLPVLDRLQDESKEFLQPGGRAKLAKAEAASTALGFNIITPEIAAKFGIDPETVARYNKFVGDQNQAKESLKNSFVYPNTEGSLAQIGSMVTPGYLNEDYNGYSKRIGELKDQLNNETIPKLKSSLRLGYNVSGPSQQSTNNIPAGNGVITIKDSNGNSHNIFARNLTEALKRDPDAVVIAR